MKVIIFGIEKGKKVYSQEIQIIENKKIVFSCWGSSTPNAYYYKDPGQKGVSKEKNLRRMDLSGCFWLPGMFS